MHIHHIAVPIGVIQVNPHIPRLTGLQVSVIVIVILDQRPTENEDRCTSDHEIHEDLDLRQQRVIECEDNHRRVHARPQSRGVCRDAQIGRTADVDLYALRIQRQPPHRGLVVADILQRNAQSLSRYNRITDHHRLGA